jgi:hypothetical protein
MPVVLFTYEIVFNGFLGPCLGTVYFGILAPFIEPVILWDSFSYLSTNARNSKCVGESEPAVGSV